ncbi:hypothetical protein V9T40_012492 [Parthenolecanium corni]|uniref:Uncharacterized protein n=1 Tax=Parthenolecanium corni TaxID=536013 RepID=A0AAN9T8Y9_9HEMI
MHPLTTKNIDKFGGEEKQKEAARRGPKKAFKKEAHKKTHQKIRARVECGGTAGVGKGKKTKEKKSEEDWCAMSAGIVNDVVIVRELHTESYKNAPSVGSRQKYLSFGVDGVAAAAIFCLLVHTNAIIIGVLRWNCMQHVRLYDGLTKGKKTNLVDNHAG